jgi:K+-dependent Na+/Ca+ exchanger-like protein
MALAIYLLAIITDEYFIVSLDQISIQLKLPHNVAGASLMAMGSSAPELAIAVLALFTAGGAHSDVGIGTIVGSAVFNVLVITGISAIARPARISWRAAVRDIAVYVLCVALLFLIILDGQVNLVEILALLGLYAIYLVLLFSWDRIAGNGEDHVIELVEEEIQAEHERTGLYFRVTGVVSRSIGVLTGDCRGNCLRTFGVSIGLIGVISWVLVESSVRFADALQIPPVIVALTILAGGTSVPDLFASVIVARQGRGGMAVANAIGSNIFDILVGLGLPWLLALAILRESVLVDTQGLWVSVLILASTVVLLAFFLASGRLLSRKEGWTLVFAYVIYVVWVWFGG